MHDYFIKLANTLKNESLLKTEVLFAAQKKNWFSAFSENFRIICAEIVKLQNEFSLSAICRIEYTMLYTNFINRRYVAEVWVYGDDWYCDKNQRMVGELDISFLFVYFDELWDKLLSARKRYIGKVSAQEVAAFILQTIPDFYSYLAKIARFSIMDCVDKEPFVEIIKNEIFRVNVGDYMAKTKIVFSQGRNKDVKSLVEWFSKRLENEYSYEDYSGLDFSGHSFTDMDFKYTQFRASILNNVSFESSILIGANFYKACMENCRLDYCSINETDFSYSILKNAKFVLTRRWTNTLNEKVWRQVGFLSLSFRYADLTNADFRWADLTGADFTGAVLTGVDFTGAILDGAIFEDSIDGKV